MLLSSNSNLNNPFPNKLLKFATSALETQGKDVLG